MITEDYVSFETAKLLKEKGFDSECRYVYNNDGEKITAQFFMEGEPVVNNYDIERVGETSGWISYLQGTYAFLCPTLQMAMKWLREVHKIDMWVECHNSNRRYKGYIHSEQRGDEALFYEDSYEQACEAAIKYCLENLI